MSQHPDNVKRGERCAAAVYGYDLKNPEEFRDMLTDLLHYCDTINMGFSEAYRIAHLNYVSEVEDPVL